MDATTQTTTKREHNIVQVPGYIYTITHIDTGKIYIGQTIRKYPNHRWKEHQNVALKGCKTHLANAIRKYGPEAFIFSIVAKFPREELNFKEIELISLLKSNENKLGFNMSCGGDGGQNSITPESRAKISASKKGVSHGPHSEETKEKIRQSKLGKPRDVETVRKMIENRRKYTKLPEEWKKAISIGARKSRKFKLTKEQVKDIQNLLSTNSDLILARRYNISRKMVWSIRNNRYSQD